MKKEEFDKFMTNYKREITDQINKVKNDGYVEERKRRIAEEEQPSLEIQDLNETSIPYAQGSPAYVPNSSELERRNNSSPVYEPQFEYTTPQEPNRYLQPTSPPNTYLQPTSPQEPPPKLDFDKYNYLKEKNTSNILNVEEEPETKEEEKSESSSETKKINLKL